MAPPAASDSRPLRHVVIGAGAGIFNAHRPALDLPSVELLAISDVDEDRARDRAEVLDCPFYTDHRRMLEETKPDVAVIMTPHPFHAPIAKDCFQSGCHVLTEKPIAVHVREADEMIEAARAADRLLAVNFQYRHRPEIKLARKLVEQGGLGELQRVSLVATWTRTAGYYRAAPWRGTWKGEGGGVLMNQAPHNFDVLCHLLGRPSRLVAWTRTTLHQIEAEDTVQAMLEWPGGGLGSLLISTAQAGEPERLEIVGTIGRLRIGPGTFNLDTFDPDLRQHVEHGTDPYRPPGINPQIAELRPEEGDHTAVYRDFHAAILNGSTPTASGEDGRDALEIANAMIYSSHTCQQVELPLNRANYLALLEDLRASVSPEPSPRAPSPPGRGPERVRFAG
jgi:predicted dehydrogenase